MSGRVCGMVVSVREFIFKTKASRACGCSLVYVTSLSIIGNPRIPETFVSALLALGKLQQKAGVEHYRKALVALKGHGMYHVVLGIVTGISLSTVSVVPLLLILYHIPYPTSRH